MVLVIACVAVVALGLVFAAFNYFWIANLNASRKQSGLVTPPTPCDEG